jgi:hypothetical protein
VLLLIILTFVAVVLIMTGAFIPVLMYCAGIIAVIYIIVLVKNLVVQFLAPHPEENTPLEPAQGEVAPEKVIPEEDIPEEAIPGNLGEPKE